MVPVNRGDAEESRVEIRSSPLIAGHYLRRRLGIDVPLI